MPKPPPASQNSLTVRADGQEPLPAVAKPSELKFQAQIVSVDDFLGFQASPEAQAEDVLEAALKILAADQPNFNPADYQAFIASPLADQHHVVRSISRVTTKLTRAALSDVLKDGHYVFFVKASSVATQLCLLINDQEIFRLVEPGKPALIGRRDDKTGIQPDVDLTDLAGPYANKLSRKQAHLVGKNGRWFMRLDPDAHAPVFRIMANGTHQLEPGLDYEILNEIRLGFGGWPDRSFVYMTLRVVKDRN